MLILSSRDVSLRVTDFHFPQRQTHLECLHGSWDRVVSCQPVDCGLPDPSYVYHAVFSCPRGTTFGKQCSFSCGSPAILQGKLWLCQSYICIKKQKSAVFDHAILMMTLQHLYIHFVKKKKKEFPLCWCNIPLPYFKFSKFGICCSFTAPVLPSPE